MHVLRAGNVWTLTINCILSPLWQKLAEIVLLHRGLRVALNFGLALTNRSMRNDRGLRKEPTRAKYWHVVVNNIISLHFAARFTP